MQRRGGKRIRMDDPPPPEYESPMTPMTPMDGSGSEVQEPYSTPYTPYSNQPATPLHSGTEMYNTDQYTETQTTSQFQNTQFEQSQQQQHLYEQQQFDIQQQQSVSGFDQAVQYEQPATPANLRTRVTRSRARGAAAAAAAANASTTPSASSPVAQTTQQRPQRVMTIEEPKKRRPGRKPLSELVAEDESCLYFIIRQGKASLQTPMKMGKQDPESML